MAKLIGVYLDEGNKIVSLNESGVFCIYKSDGNKWKEQQRIPFLMEREKGVSHIREQVTELAGALEACEVIIAGKINGFFYTTFERKGFELWEVEGDVKDFLADFDLNSTEKESEHVMIAPQKINDAGCYFINLKEVLKKTDGKMSSKEILMPFLKKGDFFELNVICGHVPPWFEKKLGDYGMTMTVETKTQNEHEVVISRMTCNK